MTNFLNPLLDQTVPLFISLSAPLALLYLAGCFETVGGGGLFGRDVKLIPTYTANTANHFFSPIKFSYLRTLKIQQQEYSVSKNSVTGQQLICGKGN